MAEYTVRRATEVDKQEIYDVLVVAYYADMPLFKACNMTEPPDIDTWPAVQQLSNGLSIVAVSKEGRIIGVALNVIPLSGDQVVGLPEPIEIFFNNVDKLSDGLVTNLEKTTMELRIMCVAKEYRGKGISKRLIIESEKVGQSIGHPKIFAIATGAFMEAAFRKQKWESAFKYFYTDHAKVDPNFKIPPLPHDSITIFEKKL